MYSAAVKPIRTHGPIPYHISSISNMEWNSIYRYEFKKCYWDKKQVWGVNGLMCFLISDLVSGRRFLFYLFICDIILFYDSVQPFWVDNVELSILKIYQSKGVSKIHEKHRTASNM